MLDLKFIVENIDIVKEGARKKRMQVDIDKIVSLDGERKTLMKEVDEIRAKQNQASKEMPAKKGAEKEKIMEEMKKLKETLKIKEQEVVDLEEVLNDLILQVPNPCLPDVPEGLDDKDNKIVKTWGSPARFSFDPRDHVALGKNLDLIDIEKGVQVSGARFYYVKNDLVWLEFALIQYALQKITAKGFKPILPPTLVKEQAMMGTGFFPADKNEIYSVNKDEDALYLIGTSEVPLCMLHYNEIIEEKNLPIRYVGFSQCWRREAGSYGKDTHGILRVHQFDKIEMFSFCHPQKSIEEHKLIVSIEEEIVQGLKLPYQLVNVCGGDLGAPAAQKFDIEAWIPTQGKYREITSCSNTTDFQARRSKIRYKNNEGKKEYIHTLNGTGVAMARMFVAILENYQNEDGSVTIPEVLRPFMGGKEKITSI
ncbi:serine--tRNA ligase [Candidatus Peregrinibacteria bacterium]|nr:serine--tRNA ligase [Candidatus Peregrinibacteria bacterium]